MANSFLQVRINEEDKEKAAEILEGLGTNLSAVVNMLVKQIIMTESIPFDIKMPRKPEPSAYAHPHQASIEVSHKSTSTGDPVIDGIKEEYDW